MVDESVVPAKKYLLWIRSEHNLCCWHCTLIVSLEIIDGALVHAELIDG